MSDKAEAAGPDGTDGLPKDTKKILGMKEKDVKSGDSRTEGSDDTLDARNASGRSTHSRDIEREVPHKASALLEDLKREHQTASHSAYKMNHKKMGTALIFNIGGFDPAVGLSTRKGYLLDGYMMCSVFSDLGFEVKYMQDSTSREIMKVLAEISERPHQEEDCFVCIFMTHGAKSERGEDVIYSKSGPLSLQVLVKKFDAKQCPSLAGKPKLFFIQACRGTDLDDGAVVALEIEKDAAPAKTKVIPVEADFLLSQSTLPGYFAFRNGSKGSVFIRYLACTLALHGSEKDIHWILTEVNSLVANEFLSNTDNLEYDAKKQMPVFTSMLTMQLVLKKH